MFERLNDAETVQHTLLPEDIAMMQRAVKAAGVSEYDFFRAAWRAWHAAPPDEKQLERLFVGYLFHQSVPGFARHFARRVLDADSDGAIDAAALGLGGFRPVQRPQHYVRDVTAVALLALCVLPFV